MRKLTNYPCWIGEGPVWNARDARLWYVNPGRSEICRLDVESEAHDVLPVSQKVSALAFTADGGVLTSCRDGAYRLHDDGTFSLLYDPQEFSMRLCNDAKVGPDGRFYVGTQSAARAGLSDEVDGQLVAIDREGKVSVLLENMRLSNGFDWSMDCQRFYHTDSDTAIIREYAFDPVNGLSFTGRELKVPGVDGFTIDREDCLWAACWGRGHVVRIDTRTLTVIQTLPVPTPITASCGFAGADMDVLAVTTCHYNHDPAEHPDAGHVYAEKLPVPGRLSFLFE